MELLKLSKLKLRLQALVAEVRDLRYRERSATDQHHLLIQKLKRNEEESGRKIQELQGELASVKEERHKLGRKVNYLEKDNELLENKHKELKETLNNLLQSRENFMNAYEENLELFNAEFLNDARKRAPHTRESTCQMKRSIEAKDRMLSVLSEKISSYLALFDSIEKEAFSIKQIVDKVQNVVSDREEVVASLRNKMDWVSASEKAFVENISDLRNKLENNEAELRRKDRIISELEAKLDVAKVCNHNQDQMEDIQKTLSAKDVEIQNLISDKEVLHNEVGSLRFILQRIQDTVTNMNEEDKRLFSSILQHKEAIVTDMEIVDNMNEDIFRNNEEKAEKPT